MKSLILIPILLDADEEEARDYARECKSSIDHSLRMEANFQGLDEEDTLEAIRVLDIVTIGLD
jgi:hypothetical protein